jgi:hypothetical protein
MLSVASTGLDSGTFLPGEEGGGAIAGVLSGRVVPSGRRPAEMPAAAGAQPSSYLRSRLAGPHPGSSVDPSPLFAFGHGLSYTSFARVPLEPGQERRVTFRLHAGRTAFTGRAGTRIVESGEIGVAVGGASDQLPLRGSFTLAGPERAAGPGRVLDTPAVID